MDQSEIDALLAAGGGKAPKKPKGAKAEEKAAAPAPAPAPKPEPATAIPEAAPKRDAGGHVISELDTVTAVTERETNRVMDSLDTISQLVGRQQELITALMKKEASQTPAIAQALHDIMSAGKDIQDKVFEAMDLMQFQDITRQKLERIVHHLRQIHDYIIELLGTGEKNEARSISLSRTIAQTGTTPDENKAHADSIIESFKQQQQKKD
jgi:chemotaxis regulatin CheY-phosphate phosphatase CheZ